MMQSACSLSACVRPPILLILFIIISLDWPRAAPVTDQHQQIPGNKLLTSSPYLKEKWNFSFTRHFWCIWSINQIVLLWPVPCGMPRYRFGKNEYFLTVFWRCFKIVLWLGLSVVRLKTDHSKCIFNVLSWETTNHSYHSQKPKTFILMTISDLLLCFHPSLGIHKLIEQEMPPRWLAAKSILLTEDN